MGHKMSVEERLAEMNKASIAAQVELKKQEMVSQYQQEQSAKAAYDAMKSGNISQAEMHLRSEALAERELKYVATQVSSIQAKQASIARTAVTQHMQDIMEKTNELYDLMEKEDGTQEEFDMKLKESQTKEKALQDRNELISQAFGSNHEINESTMDITQKLEIMRRKIHFEQMASVRKIPTTIIDVAQNKNVDVPHAIQKELIIKQ